MGDIDVGDFNKARSFVIGWSILVFCFWFFGASFEKFSLLGNEIALSENKEHAWLMLALVAVYLLCRYYQRLPDKALFFNDDMDRIYDSALRVWPRIRSVFHDARVIDNEQKEYRKGSSAKVMDVKSVMLRHEEERGEGAVKGWQQFPDDRATMSVEYLVYITLANGESRQNWGFKRMVTVPWGVRHVIKLYAFFKGALVVSWFTDFIWPLVLGVGAVFISLNKWAGLVVW
ncbi:hypothetical protein QVM48_25570 [Pseudomonas soli]|uniref:hypothetical protein n=1 Tax=Pseudomonas soli TaxID=1306993 RepID=UPI002893BD06|nr:hypothetical protein [Pseudomonas soli]MDT3712767.1 hypothetical protein [Pseudomonas soli]MDT3730104.1 hypothetical protein [Pseudomonas soli]